MDFIDYKSTMEETAMDEQNQDQACDGHVYYKIEIKEEKPDPDFTNQDPLITTEIKEESQEFYVTEIKEENQDFDLLDQETCKTEVKEENQDLDHQSGDPAGSPEQQVSVDGLTGKSRFMRPDLHRSIFKL